jgi:hypothetical protein
MSDPHVKRFAVVIGILLATLAGSLYLIAKPHPLPPLPALAPSAQAPAPMPQATGPTITWSVPQLTQTMFPGTSATVTVSFQSDQNLIGVVVDVTSSLDGIVSANPASFAAITANQPYQVTLTLSAPPEFIKRSFGGIIHVRNANLPRNTYATPLAVNLQMDWNTVSPDNLFTINLPLDFQLADVSVANSDSKHVFLITLSNGYKAGYIWGFTPQQWTAAQQAEEYPLFLTEAGGFVYAYATSQAIPVNRQDIRTEFLIAIKTFQPL